MHFDANTPNSYELWGHWRDLPERRQSEKSARGEHAEVGVEIAHRHYSSYKIKIMCVINYCDQLIAIADFWCVFKFYLTLSVAGAGIEVYNKNYVS